MNLHIGKRLGSVHLRHTWVTAGQPGEPVHLQCIECCKLKLLRDPERFERRLRAAQGRYQSSPYT